MARSTLFILVHALLQKQHVFIMRPKNQKAVDIDSRIRSRNNILHFNLTLIEKTINEFDKVLANGKADYHIFDAPKATITFLFLNDNIYVFCNFLLAAV